MVLMPTALRRARANMLEYWYRYLATLLQTSPIVCLNYGYVPLLGSKNLPKVAPSQEHMRHYLQLYAFVAGALQLAGKVCLEVSCGYGGGAAFLDNHWQPRSYVALDLTEAPLRMARSRFPSATLSFTNAAADSLGLASGVIDAVISIEASHCYPSMPDFLAEVFRVLRPGGHLVLADYRPVSEMPRLKRQFEQNGLSLVEVVDITQNVLRSLDETHEQRSQWIAHYGPFWLRPLMGQLAGVHGSIVYRGFDSGRLAYKRFLVRKEAA